ncbi:hypothetical protein DMW99_30285 [Pseudomonas chlororaphis]|nr:hypothetical protein C1Y36_27905 [Pseudomonas sp. FW306-2-2C-D06C]PYC29888.1 hypothetical protein DMW99_30285 [Pseudomonas chlororaphis]
MRGGVGCAVVVLFAVVLLLAEPELFQGMPGAFTAVIAGERAGLARRSQVGRLQDMISRRCWPLAKRCRLGHGGKYMKANLTRR